MAGPDAIGSDQKILLAEFLSPDPSHIWISARPSPVTGDGRVVLNGRHSGPEGRIEGAGVRARRRGNRGQASENVFIPVSQGQRIRPDNYDKIFLGFYSFCTSIVKIDKKIIGK